MPDPSSQSEHVSEADSALLDAELFLKYQAPERAIKRLRSALEDSPRSIALRERMREICISQSKLKRLRANVWPSRVCTWSVRSLIARTIACWKQSNSTRA